MLKKFLFKKAISPVVATALLLVVAVISVVGFQGWFTEFSSGMFVDVEIKSGTSSNIVIETIVGEKLYVKSGSNEEISLNSLKIGGVECNVSGLKNLTYGMNKVNISSCIFNVTSSVPSVVLITNDKLVEKYLSFEPVEQVVIPVPPKYFMSVLDGTNFDSGKYVIQSSDGGFIVTGTSNSYGGGDQDIILTKFNSSGEINWTKIIGHTSTDEGYSVIESSDGGFVVTGTIFSYSDSNNDIILIKFDSNGIEQWTKIIDNTGNDLGEAVIETSDGGFLVAGATYSYGGADYDVILIKFNFSGAEQWTKYLGGSKSDIARDLIETSDNKFIVTGSSSSYGGDDQDIFLFKFDVDGTVIWTKFLGNNLANSGHSVIESSDGGFAVAGFGKRIGRADNDMILSKFDVNGDEEWTKTLGLTLEDRGNSVVETLDGGFIVAGYSSSYGEPDKDIILVKFNSSGVEQWTKIINGTGDDKGFSVTMSLDGGFVVTGETASYGSSNRELFLLKLDSNGECGGCSQVVSENNPNIEDGDMTSFSLTLSSVDETVVETDIDLTEVDVDVTLEMIFSD